MRVERKLLYSARPVHFKEYLIAPASLPFVYFWNSRGLYTSYYTRNILNISRNVRLPVSKIAQYVRRRRRRASVFYLSSAFWKIGVCVCVCLCACGCLCVFFAKNILFQECKTKFFVCYVLFVSKWRLSQNLVNCFHLVSNVSRFAAAWCWHLKLSVYTIPMNIWAFK